MGFIKSIHIDLPEYIQQKVTEQQLAEYVFNGAKLPFDLKQCHQSLLRTEQLDSPTLLAVGRIPLCRQFVIEGHAQTEDDLPAAFNDILMQLLMGAKATIAETFGHMGTADEVQRRKN